MRDKQEVAPVLCILSIRQPPAQPQQLAHGIYRIIREIVPLNQRPTRKVDEHRDEQESKGGDFMSAIP